MEAEELRERLGSLWNDRQVFLRSFSTKAATGRGIGTHSMKLIGERYLLGDKIDPKAVTKIAAPLGDREDPKAKLHPFKMHRGKQAYDKKNRVLVITNMSTVEGFNNFPIDTARDDP